jgi:hypothetical protein
MCGPYQTFKGQPQHRPLRPVPSALVCVGRRHFVCSLRRETRPSSVVIKCARVGDDLLKLPTIFAWLRRIVDEELALRLHGGVDPAFSGRHRRTDCSTGADSGLGLCFTDESLSGSTELRHLYE